MCSCAVRYEVPRAHLLRHPTREAIRHACRTAAAAGVSHCVARFWSWARSRWIPGCGPTGHNARQSAFVLHTFWTHSHGRALALAPACTHACSRFPPTRGRAGKTKSPSKRPGPGRKLQHVGRTTPARARVPQGSPRHRCAAAPVRELDKFTRGQEPHGFIPLNGTPRLHTLPTRRPQHA